MTRKEILRTLGELSTKKGSLQLRRALESAEFRYDRMLDELILAKTSAKKARDLEMQAKREWEEASRYYEEIRKQNIGEGMTEEQARKDAERETAEYY